MLVSDIGYLKPSQRVGLTDNVNMTQSTIAQSTKTNLTEGFGNYNKNNPYVFGKVNFFDYIKSSIISMFSKNHSSEGSKNISIIA